MTPSPAHPRDARAERDLERQLKALHAEALRWATACADGDADEGADLLQEAYLLLLDGRARFEGRSSLKTWLFGLLRGLAANHRRALRRRLLLLARRAHELARALHGAGAGEEGAGAGEGGDPLSSLAAREERAGEQEALESALALLSARQRQVIELVLTHDLTVEEAAAVMGVGVGSARTHYARAKERLARHLGAPEPDPNPAARPQEGYTQEGYADV